MSPTLNPQDTFLRRCFRDYVLVHKNAEFRNGDIVVLRDPGSSERIVTSHRQVVNSKSASDILNFKTSMQSKLARVEQSLKQKAEERDLQHSGGPRWQQYWHRRLLSN